MPHTEAEAVAYVRSHVDQAASLSEVRAFFDAQSIEYGYSPAERKLRGIIRDVS